MNKKITRVLLLLMVFAFTGVSALVAQSEISMTEAIAMAVNASKELQSDRSSLELKRGAWQLSLFTFIPKLSFDLMGDERVALTGPDAFNKTFSIGLTQLIWDSGKTISNWKFEEQELYLAFLELQKKEQALAESVIQGFRSLNAVRQRIAIRERNLEMARGQLKLLEVESGLGLALSKDVLEAKLKIRGMEIDLAENQLDVREAEIQLRGLLGVDVLPVVNEQFELESPLLEISADRFATMAVSRSLDMVVQRYSIQKALNALNTQAVIWIPQISFKLNAQFSGQTLPFNQATWNCGIYLDFSLPWLQSSVGVTGGMEGNDSTTMRSTSHFEPMSSPVNMLDRKGLQLNLEMQLEKLKQTEDAIVKKAKSAIERYALLWERRELAHQSRDLQLEKIEFTKLQLELGKVTRSELLTVSLELAEKELAIVDAHMALIAAERELEKLVELEPGDLRKYSSDGRL